MVKGQYLPNPQLGDKAVHTFLNGINMNVNVTAQQEFELAYYDVTDGKVNHDATVTPS